MKLVRIIVILLLAWAITYGMTNRYTSNDKVTKDIPDSKFLSRIWNTLNISPKIDSNTTWNDTDTQEETTPWDGVWNQTPPAAEINDTSQGIVDTDDLHEEFVLWEVSREKAREILANSVVHWNPNATVLFIQYCDYTTSNYCREFFRDWAMFSYQETLENNLAYAYKWFPTSFDDDVVLPHKAMVCAKNSGSPQQVLWFHNSLFQQADKLDISLIWKINNELKLPPIAECLVNNFTLLALQNDMKESSRLFDITALPTNIVINLNSGKRLKIPGYYDLEDVKNWLKYIEQQDS